LLEAPAEFVNLISRNAVTTRNSWVEQRRVVPADSGDDYLIQLARDGGVDALVTRDHHFAGIRVPGLEILPPRAIVRRLAAA
jgi:hypothetical protein